MPCDQRSIGEVDSGGTGKKRARFKIPNGRQNRRVGKNERTRQKRAKNDAERLERERQGRRKRLPGSLALLPKPVSVCYGLKESRRERVVSIYYYIFTRQKNLAKNRWNMVASKLFFSRVFLELLVED